MPKTMRDFSMVMAALFLAGAFATVLHGQQMDEKRRQIMEGFRATGADLQKGEEQFNKKQYDKAEQTLLKVLRQMPENAEASYYLAETYYQKGEFEKGLEAINDAENNYPFIGRLLARRRMSAGGQESPEAQKLRLEIEQLRGEMSGQQSEVRRQTIQTEIASKLTALNALRQKEAGQQKVEETISLPAEYLYAHGNLLFRLKRYDEALAEYEKTVQTDPRHGGAFNNAANIYFMARQYDKALEYIEKAEAAGAKVNPNFKKAVLQALGK
jgi:tetratricopeptide (TPR) repeat protein